MGAASAFSWLNNLLTRPILVKVHTFPEKNMYSCPVVRLSLSVIVSKITQKVVGEFSHFYDIFGTGRP